MDNISHKNLFDAKLQALRSFEKIFDLKKFTNCFTCSYHSIGLKLYSENNKLEQEITKMVPSSWLQNNSKANFEIFILPPSQFNFSLDSFIDESSQDCISFENNTIAIQRDFAAKILSGNRVLLLCEDSVGDGFYNFLRWFLSERLIELDKYVIHASCVLDKNEEAHIFFGHSGAGKTTITQLSSPRLTLGDDMNIIGIQNDQIFVEAGAIGGLFNSMIGYDQKRKVKGCYWIQKSEMNKLTKLSEVQANTKMLASFANLNWSTLPNELELKLMNFSKILCKSVPFYELQFEKNSTFWDLLES